MNRLRERRRRAGLTASRLAQVAGVHQNTVFAIEGGHVSAPTDAVADRLAEALGCQPADLFDEVTFHRVPVHPDAVRVASTCDVDGCYRPSQRTWCADHTPLLVRWPLLLPELPDSPTPGWESRAACRDMDPALFFPDHPHRPRPADEVVLACGRCPVRGDCLLSALKVSPEADDGIWGGTSPADRRRLRRRRLVA